ncbi:MAG: hypothetical protein ACI8T1_003470, partial [Verrucomicrobiales bacterium]
MKLNEQMYPRSGKLFKKDLVVSRPGGRWVFRSSG